MTERASAQWKQLQGYLSGMLGYLGKHDVTLVEKNYEVTTFLWPYVPTLMDLMQPECSVHATPILKEITEEMRGGVQPNVRIDDDRMGGMILFEGSPEAGITRSLRVGSEDVLKVDWVGYGLTLKFPFLVKRRETLYRSGESRA